MNKSDIELIEINYEGIAKVLTAFAELYKVAPKTEVIDDDLKRFSSSVYIPKIPLTINSNS